MVGENERVSTIIVLEVRKEVVDREGRLFQTCRAAGMAADVVR